MRTFWVNSLRSHMDFFPKVWYNAPKAPAARRENERKRIHMADERNGGLLPEGQDTMMVYINPELIHRKGTRRKYG